MASLREAGDATKIAAPAQEVMETSSAISKHFDQHDAFVVKQTMRGCIQECMGCEAKSEFKVAPLQWKDVETWKINTSAMEVPNSMYALEKSSFCCRCFWRDGRPFTMEVSEGSDAGGAPIVQYKKPCGFPLYFDIDKYQIPCCCLLPKVETQLPDGTSLGSESAYLCDCCLYVPKFKYSENGEAVYVLKPETCCAGMCIACKCCSGKGCIYVPFYFHEPSTMTVMGGYNADAPQITKVWAGWKKECCSTADTFVINFPKSIEAKRKAGLLGMTFLIDFVWFERQQDKE